MNLSLSERNAWLRQGASPINFVTMGRYVSRLHPIRLGGVGVLAAFTASRAPGRLPAKVGPVQSWHFVEPEGLRLAGVLRGDVARSFRAVSSFELVAIGDIGADEVAEALAQLDASLDVLSPLFFGGEAPDPTAKSQFRAVSDRLHPGSERIALREAFREFEEWLDR
jgi:hypothetical protein